MKKNQEFELKGKSACEGIVIGEIFITEKEEIKIEKIHIEEDKLSLEIEKFNESLEKSKNEIGDLEKSLIGKITNRDLEILKTQISMLDDPMYIKDIKKMIINEKINAEYAVKNICEKYINLFEKINNPFYAQRKIDVKDISERIILNLFGKNYEKQDADGKILIAKELTPSELLKAFYEEIKFKGIILENGGETSHVAILAKTMEIPMLMGVLDVYNIDYSNEIILDTRKGHEKIILFPQNETLNKYKNEVDKYNTEKNFIEKASKLPTITLDKEKISLKINIGGVFDLLDIENKNPDGIGLYRTELMYMESEDFPTEEQQIQEYEAVIQKIGKEKEIIIRTLDIGADKMLSYYEMEKEENPFLGIRGIRYSLRNKEIFKTQIKAILRVAYDSNIKIMYPMITTIKEIKEIKEIVEECKKELKEKKINYNNQIKQGIMIEVPSAAIMSKHFIKYVDFFSIGTNDLTQYILATDRLSETLVDLYDSYDPAVLNSINEIAKVALDKGKQVCVCGEMAGEEMAILAFLSMGIKDLSMVSSLLPKAKNIIRKIDVSELKNIRDEILEAESSEKVKKILNDYLKKL